MFGLTAVECFIVIVAIFVVLYWITPRKQVWFPLIVLVVLLSILAFKFEPNENDDLLRYFDILTRLHDGGREELQNLIDSNYNNWNTYRACAYYFYFISKFNDVHYMPAVTIFIVYGLAMLVFYKAANRFQVNKVYLFLGIMFFVSTYWYYDTASGIRNGLTFAVVFACAYYHFVEKKHIPLCYLGYVLACLTHSAAIMPVVLVFLTIITLNTSGKFMKYALIFGMVGGSALIQFLATITDNSFIQSIAGKAEGAIGDSINDLTVFTVNFVTYAFVIVILFYVTNYLIKGEYSDDLTRLYKYSSITIYFILGAVYSSLVFMRFVRWIIPVIGGLFFMIGMQIQNNQIKRDGIAYYNYFAPISEKLRVKLKSLFIIIYSGYTAVHFWYLCVGSSLAWMHF